MPRKRSAAPTRKWIATQVTALTGWVIALINVGHWTATIKIALVTIIGQALIGYLVPNDPTPGGVKSQRGYTAIELLVGLVVVLVCLVVIVKLLALL